MSKRKPNNWEPDYYMESNIIGFGSYQSIRGSAGPTKMKTPIGFVRQKPKVVVARVKPPRKK